MKPRLGGVSFGLTVSVLETTMFPNTKRRPAKGDSMNAKTDTTQPTTATERLARARVRVAALRMRHDSATGMRNALLVALRDLLPLVPVMGRFGGPGEVEFVEEPAPEVLNARAVLARALEHHASELPSITDDLRAVLTLADTAETVEDLREVYADFTGSHPLKHHTMIDAGDLRCALYDQIRERARELNIDPVADLALLDKGGDE